MAVEEEVSYKQVGSGIIYQGINHFQYDMPPSGPQANWQSQILKPLQKARRRVGVMLRRMGTKTEMALLLDLTIQNSLINKSTAWPFCQAWVWGKPISLGWDHPSENIRCQWASAIESFKVITNTLNWTRKRTGNQCSFHSSSVTWTILGAPAFCASCNVWIISMERPM